MIVGVRKAECLASSIGMFLLSNGSVVPIKNVVEMVLDIIGSASTAVRIEAKNSLPEAIRTK